MSRRRSALPALLSSPSPPSRQQQAPRRVSAPPHFSDDSPSSVKREKFCQHCDLSRTGHSISGCPNVYPPIAPKWFEKVWKMLVEPAVKRNSRLVRSLERLNALERDLPGAVYVMLLDADQVSVEMEVARSLMYEVRCLHPGDSWPGTSDGLLVIGSEAEEVESVRADLLRHAVNRDTWEDVVVDALGMDRKDFWGVTTAWRH